MRKAGVFMAPCRATTRIGLLIFLALTLAPVAAEGRGRWLSGDLHNHTWLTDGGETQEDIAAAAFGRFGLQWLANSEHGGAYARNPFGLYWDDPSLETLFLGDPVYSGGHRAMWRWQSLDDYAFPITVYLRQAYPDKRLIQGFEWHVPGHDDASVGIVSDEPQAVSSFEYRCDARDLDSSRNAEMGLTEKPNVSHADALACAARLQESYAGAGYLILNHPSRRLGYDAGAIREFNDAAPDISIGFEAFPGHQKSSTRGGYGNGPFRDADGNDVTYKARTYGGADYMAAKVGGLWDSLLGEGRRFWIFANSDFHRTGGDFWPGEYVKTYLWARDADGDGDISTAELVGGVRSGRSFVVSGDLIDALVFRIRRGPGLLAGMGQTLAVPRGSPVEVIIRFKSPPINNNGDQVEVDHVDLIAGSMTGRLDPSNPAYFTREGNPSARVIARFHRSDWREVGSWRVIRFKLSRVRRDMFFRLRGTSHRVGELLETDLAGNPLSDELLSPNDAGKAWADLWFYSNPVFVDVR